MLSVSQAKDIAMSHMADGSKHIRSVSYENLYIFQINGPDPAEGNLDPFFSVNKETGEFSDFSIADGGLELIRKFL